MAAKELSHSRSRRHKIRVASPGRRPAYTRKDPLNVRFNAIRKVLGKPEDQSFGTSFGVFTCKRWPCRCERTFSANGHKAEDVFAPCCRHKNLLPGWSTRIKTDVGPAWETALLRGKGTSVKLGRCQPGDTVRCGKGIFLVEPFPKWASEDAHMNHLWVTTLHPAKTRGRFMAIGTSGAARADREVYWLNAPDERYRFNEEGRLIEEWYPECSGASYNQETNP